MKNIEKETNDRAGRVLPDNGQVPDEGDREDDCIEAVDPGTIDIIKSWH